MTEDPNASSAVPLGDGGPEPTPLSAADEAAVHELLAALPDPEVPEDVRARIARAIAVAPPTSVTATRTTLPTATPPSGRWRHPALLQGAAVLVIVALIGAVVVGFVTRTGNGGGTTGASTVAAGNPGPITVSGRSYTAATVPLAVPGLLTRATAAVPEVAGDATVVAADLAAVTALVRDPARRQACIDQLAGAKGVQQVAIDVGHYNGKPAAVIVLPNESGGTSVDAWVVGPTCSDKDNPFPYLFQRVTRP